MDVFAIFPELDAIDDAALREGCAALLGDCITSSAWAEEPERLPFLPTPDGVRRDNVAHTRDVVAASLALAAALELRLDTPISHDHVRAAALLHDASKWLEYEPAADAPSGAVPSALGLQLPHPFQAVAHAHGLGLPDVVVNAIAAHTPFNDVQAESLVAVIVHHADMVLTDAALLAAGRPSTCKVTRGAQAGRR